MSVLSLYCNEVIKKCVKLWTFNTKEQQQPQSVSSEQKWCRNTWKIMKADYSCASKSLPGLGTAQSQPRQAQGSISQQGWDTGSNHTEEKITCILFFGNSFGEKKAHCKDERASSCLHSYSLLDPGDSPFIPSSKPYTSANKYLLFTLHQVTSAFAPPQTVGSNILPLDSNYRFKNFPPSPSPSFPLLSG